MRTSFSNIYWKSFVQLLKNPSFRNSLTWALRTGNPVSPSIDQWLLLLRAKCAYVFYEPTFILFLIALEFLLITAHVLNVQKPSAIRVDQLDRSMTRASQVPADASDAEAEIQKEDGFLPDTLFPQSTCTSNQNTSSAAASLSSSATKTLEQVSASPNASASVSASASASAGATGSATGTGTGAGSEEQDVKVSNEEEEEEEEEARYPVVVHFALRPLKLTIYREPKYQRLYKQLTKLHYLLMNKRRITRSDRAQLQELCKRLEQYHSERCDASCTIQAFTSLTYSLTHSLTHSFSLNLFLQFHSLVLVLGHDMTRLGRRNVRWQWSWAPGACWALGSKRTCASTRWWSRCCCTTCASRSRSTSCRITSATNSKTAPWFRFQLVNMLTILCILYKFLVTCTTRERIAMLHCTTKYNSA